MQYGANAFTKGYTSNLVPTDNQSLAFARTVRQVQNIVYGAVDATKGLFFPDVSSLTTAHRCCCCRVKTRPKFCSCKGRRCPDRPSASAFKCPVMHAFYLAFKHVSAAYQCSPFQLLLSCTSV